MAHWYLVVFSGVMTLGAAVNMGAAIHVDEDRRRAVVTTASFLLSFLAIIAAVSILP